MKIHWRMVVRYISKDRAGNLYIGLVAFGKIGFVR